MINLQGSRQKVFILAITCLWSRAVALYVCRDASTKEFLRALQLHCYDYGVFHQFISDMGSQIQAGANVIKTFLSDHETRTFLVANGIKEVSFQHYAKGCSSLGSLIETLVKQVKYLICKSIKNIVLDYFDFHFLIMKTTHLINRRPIAFKECLRTLPPDEVPVIITPEILIKGYEGVSLNIVPELQQVEDCYNPLIDSRKTIRDEHEKLRKVRENLIDVYHAEFLTTLVIQAVDKSGRYKPVKHETISPGDVVLLSDKYLKRYMYPMGRVVSVEVNSIGEVTAAKIFKGDTKETVYRHVTSLILLIPNEWCNFEPDKSETFKTNSLGDKRPPSKRVAALKCREKLTILGNDNNI